jgi:hypothetical protein
LNLRSFEIGWKIGEGGKLWRERIILMGVRLMRVGFKGMAVN